MLSVEVWDTGIGIPEADLQAIFDEYHQVDTSRASAVSGSPWPVHRATAWSLAGHRIRVRSRLRKGSCFTIEIPLPPQGAQAPLEQDDREPIAQNVKRTSRAA